MCMLLHVHARDTSFWALTCGCEHIAAACDAAMGAQCASTKLSLWPTEAYKLAAACPPNPIYRKLPGYSDSISCDEFPCELIFM